MPEINLTKILSVSSEEKNFHSESLLQSGQFRKWKCKQGEAKAIVIIQLEKSSYIDKIDIGNEGSAFIEVLVGRSSLNEQDFHVILVASSFMSPSESKSSQNMNRVRMFGEGHLNKSITSQKWDVVKIVCTQPFNKNHSYGISFVKFYSPLDEQNKKELNNIGSFQMKTKVDDKIEIGSFFKKRNLPPTLTTKNQIVANIKAASEESSPSSSSTLKNNSPRDENQHTNFGGSVLIQSVNLNSNKKLINNKTKDESLNVTAIDDNIDKTSTKNKSNNIAQNQSSKNKNENLSISTRNESTPPIKKLKLTSDEACSSRSLYEIMVGVVFTISGIANPMRGRVRDRAIEMGAKYKPDWDDACTHLICAFENTPKFSQVNGKGIIVKKEWIETCYQQKKLLSWKDFRLGRAKSPPNTGPKTTTSQTDIATQLPSNNKLLNTNISTKPQITTNNATNATNVTTTISEDSDEIYAKDTDSESDDLLIKNADAVMQTLVYNNDDKMINKPTDINDDMNIESEGSDEENRNDTDEELQEFIANEKKLQKDNKENEVLNEASILEKLPDFFSGKTFLLYGSFTVDERKLLKRYIIAYDGKLCEYMDECVRYVVTNSNWDLNFDQALNENENLIFVRPTWLSECSEQQKLTPFQKHIVPAT